MNVSEMENLIQQITDQICQQLLSSSYSVALAEVKEAFPEEMFVRFPDVNWVTKEQKRTRLGCKRLTICPSLRVAVRNSSILALRNA